MKEGSPAEAVSWTVNIFGFTVSLIPLALTWFEAVSSSLGFNNTEDFLKYSIVATILSLLAVLIIYLQRHLLPNSADLGLIKGKYGYVLANAGLLFTVIFIFILLTISDGSYKGIFYALASMSLVIAATTALLTIMIERKSGEEDDKKWGYTDDKIVGHFIKIISSEEDSDKIKMTIQLCRDKGDYEIVIKKVNPHINFQINKIDEEKPT